MLKIAYVNVNGLSLDKLSPSLDLLRTHLDVLVLAETWDITFDLTRTLPEFVGGTERRVRHGRRADGGMIILARTPLIGNCSIRSISDYHILFNVDDTLISALYLPPSLNTNEFDQILGQSVNSHVTIGDFNVRLGKRTHDTVNSPSDRIGSLSSWVLRGGVKQLLPDKLSRVDHAFVKADLNGTLKVFNPPFRTDHIGITAHITVDKIVPEGKQTRRFHLKALRDPAKINALLQAYRVTSEDIDTELLDTESSLHRMQVSQRITAINHLDNKISEAVREACEISIGSYTVNEAKAKPDSILNDLKANANPSVITQLYKRSCRAGATKLVSSTPSLSLNTEIRNHFQTVFTPPYVDPVPDINDFRISDARFDLAQNLLDNYGIGCYDLASWFTPESIVTLLARYNVSKCCGNDSIHTRVLRVLCAEDFFPTHLSRLFQLCAISGITPSRWNKAVVFPLPKKPQAKHIFECRPIALTVMFRRAFENTLLRYIRYHPSCAQLRNFSRIQGGFRSGHSTVLHAALSNDIGQLHPKTKRVFVDFRQAYDRVPLHKLFDKVSRRNVPLAILSLLISLFVGTSLDIVANGSVRSTITMYRGLIQGSKISPFLFNVFIDDLARSLDDGDSKPNALLLADDLQLLVDCTIRIQQMLDILSNWTIENGMEVGFDKTKYMSNSGENFLLCGQLIERTFEYKYLGFPHRRNRIDFDKHLENGCKKATNALNNLIDKGPAWPSSIRLALCRTFVFSRLDYGLALIPSLLTGSTSSDSMYDGPQQVLNSALRFVLPYASHATKAAAVCAVTTIKNRALGLAASFCNHIDRMEPDHPARHYIHTLHIRRPLPEHAILPQTYPTELHRKILDRMTQTNTQYKLQLKKWYLETIESSETAKYISRFARKQRTGADVSLFIPDDRVRNFATRWRLGCFSLYCFCHVCNQPFTRAHPKRCNFDIETPQSPTRFIPPNAPEPFGPIDIVINSKDILLIEQALNYLDMNVTR